MTSWRCAGVVARAVLGVVAFAGCHLDDFRTRRELGDALAPPADAITPPGDATDAAVDTGCAEEQSRCGAVCVSLQSDPMNCGTCGMTCPAGGSGMTAGTPACVGGACRLSCERGHGDCDGQVSTGCETDTDSDAENCGGCGMQCPADPNGVPTCTGSMCNVQCNQGFARGTDGRCARRAPRQVWPPSGATVTVARPTLVVEPIAGATVRVEICRDPACSGAIVTVDAPGPTAVPSAPIAAGTVFWRTRGVFAGVPSMQTSPMWSFRVLPHAPELPPAGVADTAWGTTLDLTGDGVADVAIGAPDTASGAGRVRLALGSAPAGPTASAMIAPPRGSAMHFGRNVAAAGDVNGDGFGDLAVAADGEVYVYTGNAAGVGAAPTPLTRPVSADANSFGRVIAAAGDTNGDGYADLVVAAPAAAGTMPASSASGRVYVYRGGANGIAPTAAVALFGVLPDADGRAFGASVAGACDINNDHFADLVIGQPSTAGVPLPAAFVFTGSADGMFGDAPSALRPSPALDGFGASAACLGDTNGDGRVDFAVGSSAQQTVFVYPGGVSVSARIGELTAPPGAARFGAVVASAGEINGDGLCDIAVGAPGSATGGAQGLVALFAGSTSTGPRASIATRSGPGPAGDGFGGALAPAADLDGDGALDLVVAASFAELMTPGQVLWFRGMAPSGLFETSGRAIAAGAGDAGFGAALALDGSAVRGRAGLQGNGTSRRARCVRVESARQRRPLVVGLPAR